MSSRRLKPVGGPANWSIGDFGRFYVENRKEFIAYASKTLGNTSRSDELVQDAFLKVILAAPELVSEEHARAYLRRTISSLCTDLFRLEGRRPNLVLVDDFTDELEAKLQPVADHAEILVAADDAALVRQALSLLSSAERAALVMWEIEGRSTSEIATELGLKEKSVRHTVSRARKSLRRALSEIVVDKERGLTALQIISSTYSKSLVLAKKSSKAALSLVLVFALFVGFSAFQRETNLNEFEDARKSNVLIPTQSSVPVLEEKENGESNIEGSSSAPAPKTNLKKTDSLIFPGLGEFGVPIGFTIGDSSGNVGEAYFSDRPLVAPVSYLGSTQIVKTKSSAANILIVQSTPLADDSRAYGPVLAFGKSGEWVPLLTRVSKSEFKRLPGGRYLFTAHIAVDSEVDSLIRVASEANGRDLEVAPKEVVTRILLDRKKLEVLAQAVYVVEGEAGA